MAQDQRCSQMQREISGLRCYDGPARTPVMEYGPSSGSRLPAAQLSNQEIVREARELHAHFEQLAERYEQAPPANARRSAKR